MEDFDSIILPPHGNPIVIQWLKQGKLKIVESGCWEWQKCRTKYGYGSVGLSGSVYLAHRIAISAMDGLCSLHSCDNPPCCNPWHLREGTRSDNMLDSLIRDRRAKSTKLRGKVAPAYGVCSNGCGRAKLRIGSRCIYCVKYRIGIQVRTRNRVNRK